jgi:2-polyprenyl-3-methyl-5-hydroxy-6-metoxy-1,4-benzoquinol methylase
MRTWTPSDEHTRIAEANKYYYQQSALRYTQTETCVSSHHHQVALIELLRVAVELLDMPPTRLHALDACGGSGNAALKLHALGVHVTVCDISLELLQLYQQQALLKGYQVRAICSEIGTFLSNNPAHFDLIVFSSALHHLADIEGVLAQAAQALRPGGLILSIFDPTPRPDQLTRLIQSVDYLIFKLWHHPSDVLAGLGRRLRRLRAGATVANKQYIPLAADNLGVLAEYHVERGLDDLALVASLQQTGLEVLRHQRSYDVRHRLARWLLRLCGQPTNFSLVIRKPVV